MKKIYTLSLVLLASVASFGQVAITALNMPYSENFDSMGIAGTSLPTNWSATRFASTSTPPLTLNETLTVTVGNGSSNSGGIYNMGVLNATDRAICSLASGGTTPVFGVNFINNTGNQITAFNITALVEQWRLGTDVVVETMPFAYSTDATSLFTGTWTNVTALDVVEIQTANAPASPGVANIDGSLAVNQSTLNVNVNISSTPWANGSTFWIRWNDINAAGSDCALAIDNFTFRGTSSVLSNATNSIAGLSIFPNPTNNGSLYVTTGGNLQKTITIFDLLGQQVLKANVTDEAVNVGNLKSGVYFVKVTEDGKTATRKLVINN
jgi:hypothetical protein